MKPKKDDQEPLLNVGDVNLAPRETVSAILRRHRKQTGQDLKAVAEALRIRYVYLEAIEQGRYDALPGPTYALGFIKTYAEYLNLDEDEIVQRFREDVDGLDDQTQLVFPSPVPEGKVPGGAILLVALLMGSMAYGGWHYLSNRDSGFADFIPALPDRLHALFDGETSAEPERALAAVSETPAPSNQNGGLDAEETAAAEPSVEDSPESSAIDQSASAQTDSAPVQESVAASAASIVTETPAPVAPQATAENSATESSAATAASPSEPPAVPEASVPVQTAEASSSSLAEDTVAVATLAAPSSSNTASTSSTSEDNRSDLPQGTTVISSQTVTNQVAAAEIPAAPAAPVTTQTVSVPDATQPQVYGEDNADARIILRATQDAWVQVRDSANELLLTRVLREGDVYRVPNQEGLTLLTGNAGGIDVLVDGTLLAPLGPVGSVRRDLALDPQVLLAGTASQ